MILQERFSLLIPPETEKVQVLKLHLHVDVCAILLQLLHLFLYLVKLSLCLLFEPEVEHFIDSHLKGSLTLRCPSNFGLDTLVLLLRDPANKLLSVISIDLLSDLILIESVLIHRQYAYCIHVCKCANRISPTEQS